jgi:hypothetical protein
MRPNTTVAADQYLFRRRVFRNNSHPQAISPAPHRAGALANCGETAREWNAPGNLGPDDDLSRLRLNRRGCLLGLEGGGAASRRQLGKRYNHQAQRREHSPGS